MSTEFEKVSLDDLIKTTKFLHYLKPSMKNAIVSGIEKPKEGDRSVVFHLIPMTEKDDVPEICILSAEYILEKMGDSKHDH